MTLVLTSNPDVAVDKDYFWQPMKTCPVGVKVQLLNSGGVATYGVYDGKDPSWKNWAPLPKIPKETT